jgi:hypothetical protein
VQDYKNPLNLKEFLEILLSPQIVVLKSWRAVMEAIARDWVWQCRGKWIGTL